MRDAVTQFEQNLADFLNVKYVVSLNSGSDALFLALKALNIDHGEVVSVAHTFIASIAAIHHANATPVLIDVAADMNMDVNQLEIAITDNTVAIMPVHMNGHCCNMKEIMRIADKHKLTVIEDSAQALGARQHGTYAGTFSKVGCFSLYPAKILGCAGDGGFLATDDGELAVRTRLLRDHGQEKTSGAIHCYGFNSRLDNMQAAILNAKFPHLQEWIMRRRYLAKLYHEGLQNSGLELPLEEEGFFDVYQNYVVRTPHRDALQHHLLEKGVETMVSWRIPNHKQTILNLNFNLPMTEKVSDEVLSLPMYPELTDEQVRYVTEAVCTFMEDKECNPQLKQ